MRPGNEAIPLETVNCLDLVKSWLHLQKEEKKAIISEIENPENQVCPNITDFDVERAQFPKETYL